jgi:hypothetical protein
VTTMMKTRDEVIQEIRADEELIAQIDAAGNQVEGKMSLGDLIRGGSKHSAQAYGWGQGETACALSAAAYTAAALGVIKA